MAVSFEDYQPISNVTTEYDAGVVTNYTTEISTDRSLIKYILLSICTLGLYPIYFFSASAHEMDMIAMHDGKRTIVFYPILLLSLIFVFPMFIWGWCFTSRISNELKRRKCDKKFGVVFYLFFIIIIPALCSVGIFCLWFFNDFFAYNTMIKVYITIVFSLLICISYWIYMGFFISAFNELSRCIKYKNVEL